MNQETLTKTVARLVQSPKGILAIDESVKSCNERFAKLGVPQTEEKRREFRELLITAPDIEKYISGYILFDETIREVAASHANFTAILQVKGIDIGIKVDQGLVDFPPIAGEKITQGLEGLTDRLKEYKSMGATFAKWRAMYIIGEHTPSELCMKKNAEALAQYASLCQAEDIVPIVEPEIMMTGAHNLEKCYDVTAHNLRVVFNELKEQKVFLPGIILKTSMVLPGKDFGVAVDNEEIARMTVKCLKENVPEDIGGIAFLSGGQEDIEATHRLNDMHKLGSLPWPLTFSYARAIQNPDLEAWAKNPSDVAGAQALLLEAAARNSLASIGQYKDEAPEKHLLEI